MSAGTSRGFIVGALIGGVGLVIGVFIGAMLNAPAPAPVTVDDAGIHAKIDRLERRLDSLSRRPSAPLVATTTERARPEAGDAEPTPLLPPDTTFDRLAQAIELLTERVGSGNSARASSLRRTEVGGVLNDPIPMNADRVTELLELGEDVAREQVLLSNYAQVYERLGTPTVIMPYDTNTQWTYSVDHPNWKSFSISFSNGLAVRVSAAKRRR